MHHMHKAKAGEMEKLNKQELARDKGGILRAPCNTVPVFEEAPLGPLLGWSYRNGDGKGYRVGAQPVDGAGGRAPDSIQLRRCFQPLVQLKSEQRETSP
ncbi:hypothetical protein RRG08_062637 [Elysia crispata]|uniref:Uncharacterized protein n=1 Tax=Elysia crispata TaxID=231223 RepID=A0AAE0YYX1_9GAST|nr:hypothetical protein RRG08_062637 [Elysia crispata]